MCIGGRTTVSPPPAKPASNKPPVYMRNTYLDGLGIGAENSGRNSLVIDRTGAAPSRGPYLGISPNPMPRPVRRLAPGVGIRQPGPGIGSIAPVLGIGSGS